MIDIQFIRDNPEQVQEKAKQKGIEVDVKQLLGFDKERRELLNQVEEKRRQRNEHASMFKKTKGTTSQENIDKGKALKEELSNLEHKLDVIDLQFIDLLKSVPNMPIRDVPVGLSENENKVDKKIGKIPDFNFEPKSHWEIAQEKDWIDKERAAKVTGARFAYVKGDLVKLQFAIINFVINTLSDEGELRQIAKQANISEATKEEVLSGDDSAFKIKNATFNPVLPPLMLKTKVYDEMDRLEPQDDRYKIEGEDLWLQGSAEHVLGSMYQNERLSAAELPIRLIGFATSFRREAGTYGKDMEGIIRMHQFDKLEMESITTAGSGLNEHLFLVAIQEYLLQKLDLPYQVLLKCTADIGKPNARGVDMEVWFPSQGRYRETHTADYMTDYQSRRLNTTYRPVVPADGRMHDTPALKLVHTNDATAFALGRIMAAIIENHQTKDGDVLIPKALQSYMNGKEKI